MATPRDVATSGGSESQADFNLGDRELVFLPIAS